MSVTLFVRQPVSLYFHEVNRPTAPALSTVVLLHLVKVTGI